MSENLQHLLEKIQKDGIDKAENESTRIIDEAKLKAGDIIKRAKEESSKIVEKAESDAANFEEKGRKSLDQAARDVIISVKSGIQSAISSVILAETSKAMTDETLSSMLVKIVDAYCSLSKSTDVLVNEADVDKFKQFILTKINLQAQQGIEVVPDDSITKGFRVVIKDKHIEHDLTDQSVSEALCRVLRPHIAAILEKNA